MAGSIAAVESPVYSLLHLGGVETVPIVLPTGAREILTGLQTLGLDIPEKLTEEKVVGRIEVPRSPPTTLGGVTGKGLGFLPWFSSSQELEQVAEYGSGYAMGSLMGEILVSAGVSKGMGLAWKGTKKTVPIIARGVKKGGKLALEKLVTPSAKMVLGKTVTPTVRVALGPTRYMYYKNIAVPTWFHITAPSYLKTAYTSLKLMGYYAKKGLSTSIGRKMGILPKAVLGTERYFFYKNVAIPTWVHTTAPSYWGFTGSYIKAVLGSIGEKATVVPKAVLGTERYLWLKSVAAPTAPAYLKLASRYAKTGISSYLGEKLSIVPKAVLRKEYLYYKSAAIPTFLHHTIPKHLTYLKSSRVAMQFLGGYAKTYMKEKASIIPKAVLGEERYLFYKTAYPTLLDLSFKKSISSLQVLGAKIPHLPKYALLGKEKTMYMKTVMGQLRYYLDIPAPTTGYSTIGQIYTAKDIFKPATAPITGIPKTGKTPMLIAPTVTKTTETLTPTIPIPTALIPQKTKTREKAKKIPLLVQWTKEQYPTTDVIPWAISPYEEYTERKTELPSYPKMKPKIEMKDITKNVPEMRVEPSITPGELPSVTPTEFQPQIPRQKQPAKTKQIQKQLQQELLGRKTKFKFEIDLPKSKRKRKKLKLFDEKWFKKKHPLATTKKMKKLLGI